MTPRHDPLRPGDSPGRQPGDRPVRFDDEYENDQERRAREHAEWVARHRKLTDDQVRLIRRSRAPHAELAREFGVDESIVRAIRAGRAYRGVV